METLERGPRKRGKKLYRLNSYGPSFFIWRTGIDVVERTILSLAGYHITDVPKEKEDLWISKSKV